MTKQKISALITSILILGSIMGFLFAFKPVTNIAVSSDGTDPKVEPIPELILDDPDKAMVVRLAFNGPYDVSFDSAKVSLQRAATNAGGPPLLLVRTYDDKATMIEEFNAWHPLWMSQYNVDGSESLVIREEGSGRFVFPFHPDLGSMKVFELPTHRELITVDLRPAVHAFCVNNPSDPDCKVSDLAILSVTPLSVPPLFLVGESNNIEVRTVMTNNGPDAPMDANFSTNIVTDSEVIVTPITTNQDEIALELNEERQRDISYNVECLEPGEYTITFTSGIEPLPAAVTDPDETNNEGKADITVDCAVPVSINIMPGGEPNSINLGNKGSIPVAVLTTAAGEYGNPLAFDARTIDPTNVRFGDCTSVISDAGGAVETHQKGHIEDAFELDEKTKDGDLDMLLHFKTSATGLTNASTEACIKGDFVDETGGIFTFLGSDFVRIVP